jgi:hypothetical protein
MLSLFTMIMILALNVAKRLEISQIRRAMYRDDCDVQEFER